MKRNFNQLNEALEHYMKKHEVDNRENLLKLFDTINQSPESNTTTSATTKPKYIFMNRLVLSKKEILSKLKEYSYEKVQYESQTDTQDGEQNENLKFKKFIDNLAENQFVKDNHVKGLYVFKYNSNLNKNNMLFNEGHLLQIDKVNFSFLFINDVKFNVDLVDSKLLTLDRKEFISFIVSFNFF
jgi:hypothetical protein